jgi:hypothetical protein
MGEDIEAENEEMVIWLLQLPFVYWICDLNFLCSSTNVIFFDFECANLGESR